MKAAIFICVIFSILQFNCEKDFSNHWPYRQPENINDGLSVGSLEEVNIEEKMIAKAVGRIYQGKYKEVHSILIFKDNKLVFEEYFPGHKYEWTSAKYHGEKVNWDREMLHTVMSVTKSITSTCIGIAIDHGFIKSVHQSIFDYLPDHQHLNSNGKDKITIEHLLTMTSGLTWDEWGASNNSRDNDIVNIGYQEDQIAYVLTKSLKNKPGTSFTYSGGNIIVLGEIIRNATQMNLDEFSEKYLFEPLGINLYYWSYYYNNVVIDAAGGLYIAPREMTKIGVTFLNKGVWNGKRIISERWIEKCASSYVGNSWNNHIFRRIPPDEIYTWGKKGYSYSWWIHQFSNTGKDVKMFYAGGWGGQNIMVFPGLKMVVVFTGGNYTTDRPPFEILKRFILPAIE